MNFLIFYASNKSRYNKNIFEEKKLNKRKWIKIYALLNLIKTIQYTIFPG